MTQPTVSQVLAQLWRAASLPPKVLEKVTFTGPSHPLPSSFRIGIAAQASIAATALAAAVLRERRSELKARRSASKATCGDLQLVFERVASVSVDSRDAVLEFSSEKHLRVHSQPVPAQSTLEERINLAREAYHISQPEAKVAVGVAPDAQGEWDVLAGVYATLDGWVRLHTNFQHHKAGLLQILGLLDSAADSRQLTAEQASLISRITREQVTLALSRWYSAVFEATAREKGMCATMLRTEAEWDASAMGVAVREWVQSCGGVPFCISPITESSVGTAPSVVEARWANSSSNKLLSTGFGGTVDRPLRVLDLSRVLAGPIASRTLAGYGAQTLLLSSPRLPNLPLVELDTARGKRTAWAELDDEDGEGKRQLKALIEDADVLLQAYRPKGIAARGFSPQEVQNMRPGITYASLSAYGPVGPWADVRGFDSLTQTATGMNHSEALSYLGYQGREDMSGEAVSPRAMPCQVLDHAAAYMLAFGILASQIRSTLEELSSLAQPQSSSATPPGWHVEVSLAAVSFWLKSLGRVHGADAWEPAGNSKEYRLKQLAPLWIEGTEATLFAVRHAAKVEGVEMDAERSAGRLRAFKAAWW